MRRGFSEELRKIDWILFGAVGLLFCLGLAAIYSVSLGHGAPVLHDFKKQLIFGLIGAALFFVFALSNYSSLWVYNRFIFGISLLSLVLVLFIGATIKGTRGWFHVAGLSFQPVELAKIALIIVLAKFFSNRLQQFNAGKHIIVSLFFCLLLILPVLFQPDIGSALVITGLWFIMLILSGLRKKHLFILLIICLLAGLVAWGFALKDYQKERIKVFLNLQSDPQGSGYNVSQSLIAIGSGRLWGRGLGFGSQSQLKFIPEAHTDFIFAVIAEELGVLGVVLVLGLWGIIFFRLINIARRARDDFGLFLVLGVISVFFIHIIVNIGMNLGIFPVMGLSLPFLSYGGSFLVVSFILLGIAESVEIRR